MEKGFLSKGDLYGKGILDEKISFGAIMMYALSSTHLTDLFTY